MVAIVTSDYLRYVYMCIVLVLDAEGGGVVLSKVGEEECVCVCVCLCVLVPSPLADHV